MIRIGIAGWDYRDWAGIVYPDPRPRGFDRLSFLSDLFDAIEINSTFYRQPEAVAAGSWTSRVPAESSFLFTAKLFQGFTHATGESRRGREPRDPGALDLPGEARAYLAGIGPLLEAGRLGAVLMQFPHSFHDRPAGRAHLETVAGLLPGLPLVAEFRHRSWDSRGALAFLRDLGVGFCNIDQPALGTTLPPTAHVTSRIAYVRLHGRNAANWFAPREPGGGPGPDSTAPPGAARYDYLYSMEELRPWVDRIRSIAAGAEEVFVIANNHYRGKGPANALMLKSVLAKAIVRAPAGLVAAYPELQPMARPVEAPRSGPPRQGRLF